MFQYPMLFCLFKFLGGIACILANMSIMVRSESITDVVKDCMSIMTIMEIDNIMLSSVSSQDKVSGLQLFTPLFQINLTDRELLQKYFFGDMDIQKLTEEAYKTGNFMMPFTWYQKTMYLVLVLLYRVISVVYHLVYFYFFPFAIIAIVLIFGDIKKG